VWRSWCGGRLRLASADNCNYDAKTRLSDGMEERFPASAGYLRTYTEFGPHSLVISRMEGAT
jgi:hypothetical protein